MGWQAWLTLGVVAAMGGLFVFTAIGPDLILLGAVTALVVSGVSPIKEAFGGFANEALITVAALLVVAAGIRQTGALAWLVQGLLGRPRTVRAAQVRMMIPVAAMSAFVNNTPLVAIMLPVVMDWAKKINVSPSKLMMPLSFATILGGLCTMVGTSTNLVVNGLLAETRQPTLDLFDVTWIGLPCAAAGFGYMLLASRWLLPDRKPVLTKPEDARHYTVEMLVAADSPLIGRTVEEAGLRHLPGLFLVEIGRNDEVLPAVSSQERLQAHDRLVFVGLVESVVDLQGTRGLVLASDQVFKLDSPRSHRCLIEAVVSNTCPLVGLSIREGRFRTVYNAAIIALARNGERVRAKLGDIVLQAGDTLLLEAHPWFLEQQKHSRDFFLLSRLEGASPPRHDRAGIALAILAGVMVAAGFELLSMLQAALVGACLMILTRCCSGPEARRALDIQLLAVIGLSLGIGRAMDTSGAARHVAETILGYVGEHPWPALAVIYVLTMLFTELMSNTAAAVLVFPIALATANALQVQFLPFAMAIMMAASCGFATPIGYQTNLMVFGPGGYRFSDYFRFGGPLNLVVAAVTITLAPLIWSF